MVMQVLDSTNLVEAVTTGKIPVPAGIAEDNEQQAAKKNSPLSIEKIKREPYPKVETEAKPEPKVEAADDDVEGEDGLTPRQKREYTAQMLKTIAKKHRAQRTAEELATRQYNDLRMSEERSARLEREIETLRKGQPAAEVKADGSPDRAKFATDAEYQDALLDYRVDQRFRAKELEVQQEREVAESQALLEAANERIEAAKQINPDYEPAMEAHGDTVSLPEVFGPLIQESPLTAEINYFFATHPDEAKRLCSYVVGKKQNTTAFVNGLSRALFEFGKIESKLSPFAPVAKADVKDGAEPSSPETGSAPSKPRANAPIIRPLSSSSGTQVEVDPRNQTVNDATRHVEKKYGTNLHARKRH